VTREEQQRPEGGSEYEEARLLLTKDVNAAVEGALNAGATHIIVEDGHGARGGYNLVPEELHEGATYAMGGPRPCVYPGLDRSFDEAFMVGSHAMVGTEGAVLEHTQSTRVIMDVHINGIRVGEIGTEASIAGYFGVPVALVTGDDKAAMEARGLLGDVETVAVKEGVSRNCAICLAPKKARRLITEAAERAVRNPTRFKPYAVRPPVDIRVEYSHPTYADRRPAPGVERIGSRALRFYGDDLLQVLQNVGWY
jgi:D-amino peptidase